MVSSGTTGRQASVTSINGSSGPEVFTQTDFATAPIGKQGPDAVDMLSGAAAAAAATEAEKLMSLREAVRTYPKAIGWSILLSSAIIMEGFDQVLTPTFFALDQFKRFYGELQPNGTYEVPAPWQAGLTNGGQVGSMIGLLVNGYASERFGYRKTMIGAMIWMACTIFLFFFAHDIQMLQAGMVLAGIPWGVFQTLSTTYAAEVCPTQLRSYLTTYVNLCWVIGQIFASGVVRGMLSNNTSMAYRIPYAMQWIWPIPIVIGTFFAPESPWWLVRKDRLDDARKALIRLTSASHRHNFDPDDTIAMMKHTNDCEKRLHAGTSYLECFKGVNLRRTEIACVTWAMQNLCGNAFMGYSTYFFTQAGLPEAMSFNMSIVQYAIGLVGTLSSWFLMPKFGRRTLYLYGMAALCLLMAIIGFVGFAPKSNPSASWAIGAMLLLWTLVYDVTIGPVCYSLVAELPSTRLRIKTVVLARFVYNIGGIFNYSVTPYMLNPTGWNWGAKTGIFWAGMCALGTAWIYFRLPEPKGRTYGELDVLFANKVSARKFSSTKVDVARSSSVAIADDQNEKPNVLHVDGI